MNEVIVQLSVPEWDECRNQDFEESMFMEGIVGLVCCILCGFPFFVIGHFGKDSREPIVFWTGDKTLKEKVKDIHGYNSEMSKLFIKCGFAFVITGILCVLHFGAAIVAILLECTLGIYIVWKLYKNTLLKYS